MNNTYKICPKCGYISLNKEICYVCNHQMIETGIEKYEEIIYEDMLNNFEFLYNKFSISSNCFNPVLHQKSKKLNQTRAAELSNSDFAKYIQVCPRCGDVAENISECRYCGSKTINTKYTSFEFTYNIKVDSMNNIPALRDIRSETSKLIKRIRAEYCYDNPKFSEFAFQQREEKEAEKNAQYNNNHQSKQVMSTPPQVCCPKCGSASIATTNRGYSLLTGFLGSNKKVNVCQACGHQWKPGSR